MYFGILTFDKSIPCGMLAFCFFLNPGNLLTTAIQQLQQSCFISLQLIKEYYLGEKIWRVKMSSVEITWILQKSKTKTLIRLETNEKLRDLGQSDNSLTALGLPEDCQRTAWKLSETAWQLPDDFLKKNTPNVKLPFYMRINWSWESINFLKEFQCYHKKANSQAIRQ